MQNFSGVISQPRRVLDSMLEEGDFFLVDLPHDNQPFSTTYFGSNGYSSQLDGFLLTPVADEGQLPVDQVFTGLALPKRDCSDHAPILLEENLTISENYLPSQPNRHSFLWNRLRVFLPTQSPNCSSATSYKSSMVDLGMQTSPH